jgi:hypothetical protein
VEEELWVSARARAPSRSRAPRCTPSRTRRSRTLRAMEVSYTRLRAHATSIDAHFPPGVSSRQALTLIGMLRGRSYFCKRQKTNAFLPRPKSLDMSEA